MVSSLERTLYPRPKGRGFTAQDDKKLSTRMQDKYNDFMQTNTPPFPTSVMLEVSNVCQYRCEFCSYKDILPKPYWLDIQMGKDFLKECFSLGTREVGINGCGEQFLHKDIAKFIEAASTIGYKYIYATSNGASPLVRYLDSINAGLHSLKFSFNADTSEMYSKVHHTSRKQFYRVKNKIEYIINYIHKNNKKTKFYISCVTSCPNENLLKSLKNLFPDGIDEIVLYLEENQAGQHNVQTPSIENICYMPFNFLRLTSSGHINICCQEFRNLLGVERYKKNTLKDCWNGELYQKVRRMMLKNNLENILCSKCINNTKSKVVPLNKDIVLECKI